MWMKFIPVNPFTDFLITFHIFDPQRNCPYNDIIND